MSFLRRVWDSGAVASSASYTRMAPVNAVLAPPPPVSASQLEVQKRNLRRCNWAAAGFHFASFIAAITVGLVFLSDSAQVALTTDFLVYDANATVSTGGTAPDQAGPFSQACKVLGYYQVIWLVEFEPLITSIFHAVIAGVPSVNAWYNDNVLRLGRNPIRWYEYSITATPMIWVIAALSGVTNIVWLVVLALGNVVLQFTGYLMEEMNREPRITKKRKPVRWTPTLLGWILFLAQWIPVFVYFFAAITSERPPDVEMVPAFVYVTVFALFFWFSLFGLLMTLHYLGWPAFLRPLYNNEVGYVSLSFLAKFTITWSILIGTATNMRASV